MTFSLKPFRVILLLALVLFSWNMGGYDLWPADEPRFGEVPREMLESGDYLAPHVNGKPYNEKPPLLFWSIVGVAKVWGTVDAWSARVPSALSAVLVIALTYLLAGRMGGTTAAIWSSVFLMTCFRFWWQARTVQIDMLLCACMTLCLYGLWRWDEARNKKWLVLIYVGMAAGMLAKGPPALVFPLLFILVYYWKNTAGRKATHWVLGTLFAIAITAAWYIPARMAVAETADEALQSGMGGNLFRNTIGRMFLGVSKAQSPWYYLTTLPVDWMPWTLILPWALAWFWKVRRSAKAHWFLWCWMVPALIFFSISIGKRAIYILPLFPAMAIVLGLYISQCNFEITNRARKTLLFAWAFAMVLLALVPIGISFTEYAHAQSPMIMALGACGALLALLTLVHAFRTRGSATVPLKFVSAQMMVVLFLMASVVMPAINPYKSAKKFCAPLRDLNARSIEYKLYSLGFSREEYVLYSEHFHEARFTGLVGLDPTKEQDLWAIATFQKDARKAITEAVEDIELSSLYDYTDAERTRLLEAIEGALIEDDDYSEEELHQFEAALREEIDTFNSEFHSDEPAFLFVQEEDWRWLNPLHHDPGKYIAVSGMNVGSRHVLLIANQSGFRQLNLPVLRQVS